MAQLGVIVALVFATGAQPLEYGELTDGECLECVLERPKVARASSTLKGSRAVHAAGDATDGKRDTAWCEGHRGSGEGQWLELELPRAASVHEIRLHGGYFKTLKTLKENARVKRVTLTLDGRTAGTFDLQDPAVPRPVEGIDDSTDPDQWFALARSAPVSLHPQPGTDGAPSRILRLTIESVYPGAKYRDLCISEVEVFVAEPDSIAPPEE